MPKPLLHKVRQVHREQRTLKTRAAVGRWNSEHTDDGPWEFQRNLPGGAQLRLTVERVGIARVADASMHADCIAWLDRRDPPGDWIRVEADPDGHYTFGGPPEQLEDEIWDAVLTTSSEDAQARIREAKERGFPASSTSIFYDECAGGGVMCYSNVSYDNSGNTLGHEQLWYYTDTGTIGQYKETSGHWERYRTFLSFDTSGLLDTATLISGVLSVKSAVDESATNFTFRAFTRDWGTSITAADWYDADLMNAWVAANKHLASYDTASGFTSGTFYDMTSTANMLTYISKTGDTRVVLASVEDEDNSEPSTGSKEFVWIWAGTTCLSHNRAKLTVTFSIPAPAPASNRGDEIDYSKRVCWCTYRRYTNPSSPFDRDYYCEESVSANDRDVSETAYTPAASFLADFVYDGRGETYVPVGDYTLRLPYSCPTGSTLSVTCNIWVDNVASGTENTVTLPVVDGDNSYGITVNVPTAKYATQSLVFRVAINTFSGSPLIYWLPKDDDSECLHWGLKTGQSAVQWNRATPVIIMETPPASSHDAPIPIAGRPVIGFLAEGVYPTDRLSLNMYGDTYHTEAHDPSNERQQFSGLVVSDYTKGIMARGSQRRYVEVGAVPPLIAPPDGSNDMCPNVAKWQASTVYEVDAVVVPTFPWRSYYICTSTGTSSTSEPVWPTDSTVLDNTVTWEDAGDRYRWGTNTFYELLVTSLDGSLMVTGIPLETILSVAHPAGEEDTSIPSPQLIPVEDCTSADEVTLSVVRAPDVDVSQYMLELELVYPDGTVVGFIAQETLEKNIGRLPGAVPTVGSGLFSVGGIVMAMSDTSGSALPGGGYVSGVVVSVSGSSGSVTISGATVAVGFVGLDPAGIGG